MIPSCLAFSVLMVLFLIAFLIRERAKYRRLAQKLEMLGDLDNIIEIHQHFTQLIEEFKALASREINRLDKRCREIELLVDVVDEKILRLSTWVEGLDQDISSRKPFEYEGNDISDDKITGPKRQG